MTVVTDTETQQSTGTKPEKNFFFPSPAYGYRAGSRRAVNAIGYPQKAHRFAAGRTIQASTHFGQDHQL